MRGAGAAAKSEDCLDGAGIVEYHVSEKRGPDRRNKRRE